jgi:rubrerythrin
METTGLGTHAAIIADVLEGLNDLLQLDHDAVGAYEIAMEKLQDRDAAMQIAGFRRDHERHILSLNELIRELGGVPRNEPHATGPLKEALQSVGALAGDKGILIAWRTNEAMVRGKYDAYARTANAWPTYVKRVVDQNALDEERHHDWVVRYLGGGEGGGALDTVRERVGEVVDAVKDRAGALGGSVAGGLSAAGNRISGMFDPEGEGRLAGVGGAAQGAARGVRDLQGGFEEHVRESPLQTLVVAAIAGFVVGRLLRS